MAGVRGTPVADELLVRDRIVARDEQNAKTPDDYTEREKNDGYEVAPFHPNTSLTSTRVSAASGRTLAL